MGLPAIKQLDDGSDDNVVKQEASCPQGTGGDSNGHINEVLVDGSSVLVEVSTDDMEETTSTHYVNEDGTITKYPLKSIEVEGVGRINGVMDQHGGPIGMEKDSSDFLKGEGEHPGVKKANCLERKFIKSVAKAYMDNGLEIGVIADLAAGPGNSTLGILDAAREIGAKIIAIELGADIYEMLKGTTVREKADDIITPIRADIEHVYADRGIAVAKIDFGIHHMLTPKADRAFANLARNQDRFMELNPRCPFTEAYILEEVPTIRRPRTFAEANLNVAQLYTLLVHLIKFRRRLLSQLTDRGEDQPSSESMHSLHSDESLSSFLANQDFQKVGRLVAAALKTPPYENTPYPENLEIWRYVDNILATTPTLLDVPTPLPSQVELKFSVAEIREMVEANGFTIISEDSVLTPEEETALGSVNYGEAGIRLFRLRRYPKIRRTQLL